ncbi:GlxA family transcriptional regulator [Aliiglaciecola sp. M165]|uniref:GlxA family transcriptional regulator n=1 Tax=Aliiglaciecola sp. M165 TaxID=2593649 RepID=UPI00117D726D|nr:helix-turn-helix domain-containing protein [Aliiglaciecola sp. M165]TRY31408.1 helix-turn-helix domain-containing protein [Aliiglaciecola sp. M165]
MILVVRETSASVAYSFIDILNVVGRAWDGIPMSPASSSGFDIQMASFLPAPLLLKSGLSIHNLIDVRHADEPDIIIIPDLIIGTNIQPSDMWRDEISWIKQSHHRGALIVGACTGSILLAESGILNDEMATSHWGFYTMMESNYPKIKLNRDDRIVVSGKDSTLITTGGYATSKELMMYLVQRFFGKAEMIRIIKLFLFGKYSSGQQPYVYLDIPLSTKDKAINESIRWLLDNIIDGTPLAGMLEAAGLPYSTFIRRFKDATGYTPNKYIQYFRIERAKKLLELTKIPLEQVCFDVGYEDPRSFRNLFKRLVQMSPSEYRRQFSTVDDLLPE